MNTEGNKSKQAQKEQPQEPAEVSQGHLREDRYISDQEAAAPACASPHGHGAHLADEHQAAEVRSEEEHQEADAVMQKSNST